MTKSVAAHRPGAGPWRDLVRLVLASLATGAVVSIVLALAVLMVATEARAAPAASRAGAGAARVTPGTTRAASVAHPVLAAPDAAPV